MIIIQVSLIGVNPKPGDLLLSWSLPIAGMVLSTINSILVLVMIPILVHQEPLVGTKAFWFTRPISRTDLLCSKALYVLLLVALPILIKCSSFVAHGVTFHDVMLAIPQLAIQECTWIFTIAAVAVLTPNFARFAIVGAIIGVVWYLFSFTLQMYMVLNNPMYALTMIGTKGMSRMLASSLVTIAFGLAIVLVQYLSRRTKLAISLVIIGALLSLSATYLWPWDYLKGGTPTTKKTLHKESDFNESQISAKLSGSVNANDQLGFRGGPPLKQVNGTVSFIGVPQGFFVRVDSIKAKLKTTKGDSVSVQPPQNMITGMDKAMKPMEAALGGIRIFDMDGISLPCGLFSISSEEFARYSESPLNFTAEMKCTLTKYYISSELELKKGAKASHGSERLLVNEVLTKPNGVDVLMEVQRLNLIFGPHPESSGMPDILNQNTVYLLVNRKLKQAVARKSDFSFNPMKFLNKGSILESEPLTLSFGGENKGGRDYAYRPVLDQAWLKDAVIVKLDPEPVATFTRRLEEPGFKMNGKFSLPYVHEADTKPKYDLSQIVLPPDPSREQIKFYINQVLATSSNVGGGGQNDPRIGMLEKVGSRNVDLLVDAAINQKNHFLIRAINSLAQSENKDQIIKGCLSNPDLMNIVISHGWQADAKTLLLGILETPSEYYPVSWITGIVSFNIPSTFDGLKNYYAEHPDYDVMKELKTLQDFDIKGAVDLAWKKAQTDRYPQYGQLLMPAVEYGEPGVLDMACSILRGSDNYLKEQAKVAFETYTPVTGSKCEVIMQNGIMTSKENRYLEIATWYDQNKNNLTYDNQGKRFVFVTGAISSAAAETNNPSTIVAKQDQQTVLQSSETNTSNPLSANSNVDVSSNGTTSSASPQFVMPTIYTMKELGRQAATGDTSAIDQIEAIREKIYEGVTFKDNRDRFIQNGELIKAALNETAKSIKGQDPSDPAFKALIYAAAKQNLGGYAAEALGIAAASGNQPSLDVLLNYPQYGLILSGVVPALSKAAEMGNPKAIEFLVKVIDNDSTKPLWYMASRGLFIPANQGNSEAKRAIARYSEYELKRKEKQSAMTSTVVPADSNKPIVSEDKPVVLAFPNTTATVIAAVYAKMYGKEYTFADERLKSLSMNIPPTGMLTKAEALKTLKAAFNSKGIQITNSVNGSLLFIAEGKPSPLPGSPEPTTGNQNNPSPQ
jgi:hypothetical protein